MVRMQIMPSENSSDTQNDTEFTTKNIFEMTGTYLYVPCCN